MRTLPRCRCPSVSRVALTIALMACSASTADQAGRAQVDTLSDGRIQVTNRAVQGWAVGTPWRLEENLRLGEADAGGPEQFGQITAVMSDPDGAIYVLDGLSQEIRVFLTDGTFSHSIGRKGRGPGELSGATGIALGRGDTLWVVDPQLGRIFVIPDVAGVPPGTVVDVFQVTGEFLGA